MNGLTFRVGAVDYIVREVEGLHDDGRELLGWVTNDDTTIRLETTMSDIRKQNVLIHELVHAMLFEAGIDGHDEDLVNRLGHVLHGVLRDNDFGFLRNNNGEESE